MGQYYDMHSPDLRLNLAYKHDSIKTSQVINGGTISNALNTKAPDWGDLGAWQLYESDVEPWAAGTGRNYRSSRRTWDLSFSYLSDTDVFPVNATTTNPLQDNIHDDTLLNGTDFFSVVYNKTLGSALPFIFQPNAPKYDADGNQIGGNNNPDQFCIAKFIGDSLKVTQSNFRTYKIKLKIEEVW